MKKSLSLALAICAVAAVSYAAPYRTIDSVKVATPPVMDGTGSDSVWNAAAWSTTEFVERGNPATVIPADFQGKFKTIWDDSNIYFLLYFTTGPSDTKMYGKNNNANNLQSSYYDGANWLSEFDIYLSPAGDIGYPYYQLMPYFETDDTSHQPAGSNNGFAFGAQNNPWVQWPIPDTLIVKAVEAADRSNVQFEVQIPFEALNRSTCNPGGAGTCPAPNVGDSWPIQVSHWANNNAYLGVWNNDPSDPVTSGNGWKPFGAVNFTYAAGVADWSQF